MECFQGNFLLFFKKWTLCSLPNCHSAVFYTDFLLYRETQVELRSGVLSLRVNASLALTQVDLRLGPSYCNGEWNKVIVKKEGSVVSASVNERTERAAESRARTLTVNSPVYLGGTPPELQESYRSLSLEQGKLPLMESPDQYGPVLPTRFRWFRVWR